MYRSMNKTVLEIMSYYTATILLKFSIPWRIIIQRLLIHTEY